MRLMENGANCKDRRRQANAKLVQEFVFNFFDSKQYKLMNKAVSELGGQQQKVKGYL